MFIKIKQILSENKEYQILAYAVFFFLINLLIEWPILEHLKYNTSILCRWDCQWYKSIVLNGYHTEPVSSNGWANFAFFPLVPLIARGMYLLYDCSPEFALIFVSKYMFFMDILLFIVFVKNIFNDIPMPIIASTFVFMPFAVHNLTGYTETTFFFLSISTFLAFKQKKYISAGLLGACLSATRPVGILMIPALAFPMTFQFFKASFKDKVNLSVCFMLMPLGLFLFMAFLYDHVGDAIAFATVQEAWGINNCFPKPFCVLWQGLKSFYCSDAYAGTIMVCLSFAAVWFLYCKKQYDLAIFLFLCTLMPLMSRLFSIMRYVLWNPAFLLVVCYFLNKYRRFLYIILPIMAALMAQTYFYFLSGESTWPV